MDKSTKAFLTLIVGMIVVYIICYVVIISVALKGLEKVQKEGLKTQVDRVWNGPSNQ